MSKTILLAITFLVSNCAGKEPPLTTFKQISDTEFTFEARTGVEYPADDPDTEATHMGWLEEELAKRDMCPKGYRIDDKSEIAAAEEAMGQTYNMAYHGFCK
jgi:hypothetical protein